MRPVNLLPPDSYAPKQRLPHAPVVLAAALPVLAGALVFLGYSLEHSKVVDRQDKLGLVQSRIAALGPSRGLVSESTRVEGARQPRLAALTDALSKQQPWDITLDQVSRLLPDGVWLTSLSAQSPTPATTATTASSASPTSFSIQGYAPSHDAVAQVLSRLALLPSLTDVALASTLTSQIDKTTVIQFSITASVQHVTAPPPGAAS